ncbi:MAG TPA: phosphoglycerate mutase (2,3-diphosphoglycerate-independent) [Phycisphaerales bacterium]|nr:phosphoglycerate mutase (2,3-diphosphoglycerate-independent) [Phycisphaerales bacterium]
MHGTNATIATVMGRFWAMDRDHRWERVSLAFEAMTSRATTHPLRKGLPCIQKSFHASTCIENYYEHPTDSSQIGDEFIVPTQILNEDNEPVGIVQNGDSVFFFNYRGDRPRELSRAFVFGDDAWSNVPRGSFMRGEMFEDLYFATMTNYESSLPVSGVAFKKPDPMRNILGDVMSTHGLQQFRCAETEKFPHVTFFFNDYREDPFVGETHLLVPSPTDVATYDQKPQMSAEGVCRGVLDALGEVNSPSLIIVNFANGDMVGHTGNLPAIIRAIEVVDECCGRIVETTLKLGGSLIITADHGNAERTWNAETKSPDTAHTVYDVPLHLVGQPWKSITLRSGGILADIAPTLLQMLGLQKPKEMTGHSLIQE